MDVKMKRDNSTGPDPTLSYTALIVLAGALLGILIKAVFDYLRVPLP
jgi:hypothetical protein